MANQDKYQKFIRLFKALANEERLEIIRLLIENKEMYAQDVERNFYLEQSTTSHHLNTLKRAGVAESRKSGRNIYYSINLDNLRQALTEFESLFKNHD